MADIREDVLLEFIQAGASRQKFTPSLALRAKTALRTLVVATAGSPLRHLYRAIYRAHLTYALRQLRKLPGVHSVYLTRGMAANEVQPGISDIDMIVYGTWNDAEQQTAIATMRRLTRLSPLYDTGFANCTQTVESAKWLYATDFGTQYRMDQGRTRWQNVYGGDIFSLLPDVPAEKASAGPYAEIRLWWAYFVKSVFGFGALSTDKLFRNSIPYKVVATVLNSRNELQGRGSQPSRRTAMEKALATTSGEEHDLIRRLVATEKNRFRTFEGDIRNETLRFLLAKLEDVHAALGSIPAFQSAGSGEIIVDASAPEMLISPAAREYVLSVVKRARTWSGYRAAYTLPCLTFFSLDDLVLLLEVDPEDLPSVEQIRTLCEYAFDAAPKLSQRVEMFLLLPHGAYPLEILHDWETWHHTLCPQANPDIFALLDRSEFVVDGEPRPSVAKPVWTKFASNQLEEELNVRRASLAKVAGAGQVPSLEISRNLWRHLQLEIVQRTEAEGCVLIPLTITGILRGLTKLGLPSAPVLDRMHEAYVSEINGQPADVHAMLPELMALFANFAS